MHELNPELEQLMRATSRGTHAVEPASGEDIELREGWSALTQLIEQADATADFDEQAFLAKVSSSVEQSSPAPRRGWLVLLGTLAASILLCIFAGGYLASQWWGQGSSLVQGEKPTSGSNERPDKALVVAQSADTSETSWDDALDERIGYFHQSLSALEAGGYAGDRSLQTLGLQMEEFGQEIDSGSL